MSKKNFLVPNFSFCWVVYSCHNCSRGGNNGASFGTCGGNPEYGFLNSAFGKEYEYPYAYFCLAVYYVNLQNALCMMKIWKLFEGIHIYVLRITFQPLWFLVDKCLHIIKGYFHISLGYIQKITKVLLNLNFALIMLTRKYSQFWALTRFD